MFVEEMRVKAIDKREWQALPEHAQREVYDFFLFIKQRYTKDKDSAQRDRAETLLFSNHSANLVKEWLDDEEDKVWK